MKDGIRGPVVTKWLEWLLADRDERVRLERERATAERVRGRYGRRQGAEPDWR